LKNVKMGNKKKPITLIALFLVLTLFLSTTGCFFSKASLPPLLLIDVNENTEQNRIRALNPKTLIEVVGKAPIVIGKKQISALSDDGSKVAIARWKKANSKEADLLILNVEKWKVEETGQKITEAISRLTFGPDGSTLYWVQPSSKEKIKDIPKNYELNSYDIKTKKLRVLEKFKSLFIPDRIHLTEDGDHIVIYGLNVEEDRMSKGSPNLITVNTKTGKVVADIKLVGVKAGLSKFAGAKKGEPGYRSYKPGLTSHKDEPLMYIAHSDDDKVTVVDMLKGTVVKKLDIKKKVTMSDSIFSIFEGTALAYQSSAEKAPKKADTKADPESAVLPLEKRAVLSSDGNRLYIAGYKYVNKKKKGKNVSKLETDGLKILEASDMSQIASFDLAVNDVRLSPDDRWLLLKHTYNIGAKKENGGFYIFDTNKQEKVAYLQKKWNVKIDGFSVDSSYAYTSYTEGSMGGHNWKQILRAVDLNTQKLIAKREVKGFFADLLVPKIEAE